MSSSATSRLRPSITFRQRSLRDFGLRLVLRLRLRSASIFTPRLCAFLPLLAVACGSSNSNAPANPGGDAVVVTDGDDGGGESGASPCPAGQEHDPKLGCLPFLAAGARTLAMDVNPKAGSDWGKQADLAVTAGVKAVPWSIPWGLSLETRAPSAGKSQIDTTKFKTISAGLAPRGLALTLTIPLVDTVAVQGPPDLNAKLDLGTMPLDDPAIIARYETVIESFYANVDPKLKLSHLIVGYQVNVFLGSKPDAVWTALKNFFEAIRTYSATKHPGLVIGMNVSFAAVADPVIRPKLQKLLAASDTFFVSYYFGSTGLGGQAGTDVHKDIETMLTFAGTKPLVLQEFGYPTGTKGNSPEGQVQFITDLFQTWDAHLDRMPQVVLSRMFDGDIKICTEDARNLGATGNDEFIKFLCTLGVRAFDESAKPSWARLADASKLRGF